MAETVEKLQKVEAQKPRGGGLSAEESLQRLKKFGERKEDFVATIRKDKD